MIIFLISVATALGVSATCSLLEAALLSFTPAQIADLTRRRPHVGKIWQNFKERIDRPIAVILILNTAAHTIGATVAGAEFDRLTDGQHIALFSLVFAFLMLQFTEILPKTLGVYYNHRLAVLVAYPLNALIKLFTPILFIVQFINKPFERGKPERPLVSQGEIAALAGMARLSNLIGAHQERIITGAWRLSQLTVRDVMIPAEQVIFLSTRQTLMDAILAAHLDPHTRFPIVEDDDHDRILGYVNFKEMIYRARTNPQDQSLRGVIRPVHFADPSRPAAELLKVFVDQHEHMAIVRDESGKTLGLVTLEDIVEELVGELEDELERLPRMFHPLSGDVWMVGGGFPIRDLEEQLGAKLSDPHGTTSAWLIRRFGRIPKVNEVYREAGFDFMVRRIRRSNVFEILVTRTSGDDENRQ